MRLFIVLLVAFVSSAAVAAPRCTDAPKQSWISTDDMRARIALTECKIDMFRVTIGNCHEIYGRDKDGKRVEVYFHPVTGELVQRAS